MSISRRKLLKYSVGASTMLASPLIMKTAALGADPLRVGVLLDLSGPFGVFGGPKAQCIELAANELNANGGVMGREVTLKVYDTQSDNQLYAQYAQQLALRDRVDVVHGGITSAAREVARPILNRAGTLYFFNMTNEGALCDKNSFTVGATPRQLLSRLIPSLIEKHGPKIYTVGADYNFGHDSAGWARKFAQEAGGEVVGEEFFPLDANDFSASIGRIQASGADAVFTIFVSPPQEAFYAQWAAAGLNTKIGLSCLAFGDTGELDRMPANVIEGISIPRAYLEEIDTPENAAFKEAFYKQFPNSPQIGSLGPNDYHAMQLWAKAVEQAGSAKRDDVVAALESGMSIQGVSGPITVDPKSHYCNMNVYLAEVQSNTFQITDQWDNQPPIADDGRCDLIANPNTSAVLPVEL